MCIQQYQNRRYHPLLDWRLGLAYLRSMTNPAFQCGLDGDFDSYPELKGWLEKAQAQAEAVASMRPKFWRAERVGTMLLAPELVTCRYSPPPSAYIPGSFHPTDEERRQFLDRFCHQPTPRFSPRIIGGFWWTRADL